MTLAVPTDTSSASAHSSSSARVRSFAVPPSMLPAIDGLVYVLWLIFTGFLVAGHEKWGDEAQAWLIARDLPLHRIWFYELRYEGTPGLWHTILWIAQHIFHMPYAGLGPLGLCFAAAGAAFILWKAPFPRPLRYLLLFSYFIAFQYAVIARPYTLLPLLLFAAASLFHDHEHPERITIALVLLSQLSVHGSLLADSIAVIYTIDMLRNWPSLSKRAQQWLMICAAILVADNFFLFLILKPTPDVAEFAIKQNPELYGRYEAAPMVKLTSIISGAFLDYPLLSVLFLAILGAWFTARRRLLLFLLPIGLIVGLYVKVHGLAHHHGTAFVALVASLWIAWPSEAEQRGFNMQDRRALVGISFLLALWFGINVWDTVGTVRLSRQAPYSGARDATNYLRPMVFRGSRIGGYDYAMTAINAYYDRNIFANLTATFYHEGMPLPSWKWTVDGLRVEGADYVVIMSGNPAEVPAVQQLFGMAGYALIHVSPGWVIYKHARYDGQTYLIFARNDLVEGASFSPEGR